MIQGKNGAFPKGFVARNAKMEDLAAAVELFNTVSRHYLGADEANLESIETEWTSPGFDLEEDILLIFDPEDSLVGYGEVWLNGNPPVHPHIWIRVHPDYEGRGIGSCLMTWAEDHAKEALPRCPAEARVAVRTAANAKMTYLKTLFENQGFHLIRHSFRMQIDMEDLPPEPVFPEGITVRHPESLAEEIEAVYRVDDEAFQDHFGYVDEPYEEGLAKFSHHFLENEAYDDPELWFLAQDGEEIAGICLCRKHAYGDEEAGYVSSLAVRRPWRKQGIGFGLLRASFRAYYARGFRKVYLGVDAENLTGALRLYEKAGMHVHWQYDVYEKELRPGEEISVTGLEQGA